MLETSEYLLAQVLPRTGQVLCELNLGNTTLPRIRIMKWRRAAKEITSFIKKKWTTNTILLDVLMTSAGVPCAVTEVLGGDHCQEQQFYPADIDNIDDEALDAGTLRTLKSIRDGEITCRGPFSRIGWIEEVEAWVAASLGRATRTINGDIDQYNASGHFALVRFSESYGASVWFKAVGVPNQHEYDVTSTIAECVGEYLPTILAMRSDWSAWLMKDEGRDLDPCNDEQVEKAVDGLAKLQKASIPHIERFRSSGCIDQNLNVLRASVTPIINYLDKAMSQQTSKRVAPLSSRRLYELEAILHFACERMGTFRLPDTLIHNDINPGNILIDGERCFFIDWAEGHVGNPFFTYQQLKAHLFRDDPNGSRAEHFEQLYRRHWRDCLSDSDLDHIFAIAPALAILSSLYGRGDWLNSSGRGDPDSQSYSRSLARHLDRAAKDPELLRSI
jgi:hypothetical protein